MDVSCSTTADALRLVESLQTYIVRGNETIERLEKEIKQLKRERNQLTEENRLLKSGRQLPDADRSTAGVKNASNGTCLNEQSCAEEEEKCKDGGAGLHCNRNERLTPTRTMSETQHSAVTLAHELDQLTTGVDEMDAKRDSTPDHSKALRVARSNSRGRQSVDNTAHRLNNYELSSDLKEKTIELLENKYGGRAISNNAAWTIQQYYSAWKMATGFKRVRAFSEKRRRQSVGCMVDRRIPTVKKTHTLSDPGSPVMIVNALEVSIIDDGTMDSGTTDGDTRYPEKDAATTALSYPSPDFDRNSVSGSPEGREERSKLMSAPSSLSTDSNESALFYQPDTDGEGTPDSKRKFAKDGGHGYDVIDDSHVMTVDYGYMSRRSDDTESLAGYDPGNISYAPTISKDSYKRQFRIGVNLFNKKPETGIDYLIDNSLLDDDPKSIALFLRTSRTVSKQKISEYFGSLRKEKNMTVLSEFAKSFNFAGKAVDEALRQFQSYFKLTGEAQSVERFLQEFSEQYVLCNPGALSDNPDTILVMAFAIAMLNTDLHNGNVKRKMTVEDFIRNLRGTNDGNDLPQEVLRGIYTRIQKNAFATGDDHTTQLRQIENSFIGKTPHIAVPHRQFVKLFNLNVVNDANRRDKPHQRFAFLFNDMLLLTKARIRPGGNTHGNGHVFSFKTCYKLLNTQVEDFSNEFYEFGVALRSKVDMKLFACFNMIDELSRKMFIDELDEYIHETQGMENIRIVTSLYDGGVAHPVKLPSPYLQNSRKKQRNDAKRSLTVNIKRRADTVSLNDLHMSKAGNYLEAEDADTRQAKPISSSMCNIVEAAADEAKPGMRRSGSSSSIDNSFLHADTPSPTSLAKSDTLPRSPHRKGIFPFGSRRRRSQEVLAHTAVDQPRKASPLATSTLTYRGDEMRVDLV